MLDEKSLETMLKTQKIFCDGSGKELKGNVIGLLFLSLPLRIERNTLYYGRLIKTV